MHHVGCWYFYGPQDDIVEPAARISQHFEPFIGDGSVEEIERPLMGLNAENMEEMRKKGTMLIEY